jgi:hypothetical protein
LLKQAHDREKNDNLIFQHKLQNELEAEKQLFGDDFKEYITPTWAKQIAENKKHAAKLAKRSEDDEKVCFDSFVVIPDGSFFRTM